MRFHNVDLKKLAVYDKKGSCNKCLDHAVLSKYIETTPVTCFEGSSPTGGPAIIERTCQNCGHQWAERPHDSLTTEELQQIIKIDYEAMYGTQPKEKL